MNASNLTNSTETASPLPEPASYWLTLFFILYIMVSLTANLLVITAFCVESRLREPFNYFLLNLCVSDLTSTLFGQTHLAVYTHYNYWPLGYRHCTLWLYFDWLSVNESLLMMGIISVDRLWATFWPVHYREHFNLKRSSVVILASWLFVNAGILPGQIYDRLNSVDRYAPTECYWDFSGPVKWATPLYVVLIAEWIPVLTTIICYTVTAVKLFGFAKSRATLPFASSIAQQRRSVKDRQAFIMLCALVGALIIGWFPWFIYSGLITYAGLEFTETAFLIMYWFGYSTALINPIILLTFNKTIRTAAFSFLRGVCRGKVAPSGTSATGNLSQGHSASKSNQKTADITR